MTMVEFILKCWRELTAFIGAGYGLWKYLDTRKRELNWKWTEFIFQEAKYLDNDPDIIKAVQVLAEEKNNITVDAIFGDGYDSEARAEYIVGFEKLFNFLDRLAHAYYSLKTLIKEEVANFNWYLDKILKHSQLQNYCEKYGYEDVVKLSKEA